EVEVRAGLQVLAREVLLEERGDERRLLQEQTPRRLLEEWVAGLGEVRRQGRVAATVDGLVRHFLEEGLVAELDLVRGELDVALEPVGVDWVACLAQDDG